MSDNKNSVPRAIPEHIEESLREIIDYLWADELKHARDIAVNEAEFYPGEHICAHLINVRAWLEARCVPVDVQSQATTLAKYIQQELEPYVSLPKKIRTAASQVINCPRDLHSIERIVDYLQHEIDVAEYCGPPDDVWDVLDQVQNWLDEATNV